MEDIQLKSEVLWVIPARSGSKSIIDKNIKHLDGIPLIGYRISTALSLASSEDVWVSTDSEAYAELAIKLGAQVPFIRPAELASDSSSSMDVVLHAMTHAEKLGRKYRFIGLLEPTSPFIYRSDLSKAVQVLREDTIAKAIVAVKESRPNTVFIQDETRYLDRIAHQLERVKLSNRQSLKKQITPSGGFYISKWDEFHAQKTFYTDTTLAYLVPQECELEIDEPMDWRWAEFLIEKRIVDIQKLKA